MKVMLIKNCGVCPNNQIHPNSESWDDVCVLLNKKVDPNKTHKDCPLKDFTDITHRPLN